MGLTLSGRELWPLLEERGLVPLLGLLPALEELGEHSRGEAIALDSHWSLFELLSDCLARPFGALTLSFPPILQTV